MFKTDYMNDTAKLETDDLSAPKVRRDTKLRNSDVVKRTRQIKEGREYVGE